MVTTTLFELEAELGSHNELLIETRTEDDDEAHLDCSSHWSRDTTGATTRLCVGS